MVKKTKGIPLKDARPRQKKGVHRREPLWILVVCLWYTPIFNLNDRGNAKVGKKEKGLTRKPREPLLLLVELGGIEPLTSSMPRKRAPSAPQPRNDRNEEHYSEGRKGCQALLA